MGNSLTKIEAYAQDVANFSTGVTSDFQAIGSAFPPLLANFQALLAQVQTSMQTAGSTVSSKPASARRAVMPDWFNRVSLCNLPR
jgi:hypothetical protein